MTGIRHSNIRSGNFFCCLAAGKNIVSLVYSKSFPYLCPIEMRYLAIRHIATLLLLLLTATQAVGKTDSLLWVGIKQTSMIYQQGLCDSTLSQARRLLVRAEELDDALAQAQLHNLMAFCFWYQSDQQTAAEEMRRCVAIGEANDFIGKTVKSRHDLYITTMLPAYSLLSVYYKDHHQLERAADYAKKGMEWIPICQRASLRVNSLSSFSEVLMAHKDYNLIYEPMRQGAMDALGLKQVDIAMMMITYLIHIEYGVMHRKPEDIPWIKLGEKILPDVKTETAKITFLAATKLTLPQDEGADEVTRLPEVRDTTNAGSQDVTKTDSIQTRIEYIQIRNERIGIVVGILALTLITFLVYILWQRHQRRKTTRMTEQKMEERYIEGQENERTRLAKELHDGISNQLLAVEMRLNEEGLTPETMQLLNESREQVRRVSHELIPPEFEHATLDEVVRNYAASLDGLHQCEVTYMQTPPDADWTEILPAKALEIYRIIQETVGNALKHASATSVSIGMHLDEEKLKVLISDNGTWKDDSKSAGIGTRTLNQRTSLIHGKIELFRHQYGSTVQLTVNRQNLQKIV